MMYVGIDPGQRGAICFVNKQGLIEYCSQIKTWNDLASLISTSRFVISHLYLEKSHSYTAQGIKSTFNYGVGFGIIQGILIANKITYSLIPPRTWQKHMILPTRLKCPKAKALYSANKVFKQKSSFWIPSARHKKPHDGMIDSALLAEYCRRSNP